MEMIKDYVAVVGITFIIIDAIISFYKIIMDDDRKQKLKTVIGTIMQIIMLYGGYRMISFFNS